MSLALVDEILIINVVIIDSMNYDYENIPYTISVCQILESKYNYSTMYIFRNKK